MGDLDSFRFASGAWGVDDIGQIFCGHPLAGFSSLSWAIISQAVSKQIVCALCAGKLPLAAAESITLAFGHLSTWSSTALVDMRGLVVDRLRQLWECPGCWWPFPAIALRTAPPTPLDPLLASVVVRQLISPRVQFSISQLPIFKGSLYCLVYSLPVFKQVVDTLSFNRAECYWTRQAVAGVRWARISTSPINASGLVRTLLQQCLKLSMKRLISSAKNKWHRSETLPESIFCVKTRVYFEPINAGVLRLRKIRRQQHRRWLKIETKGKRMTLWFCHLRRQFLPK